jgi:hypothetical protein
MKIRAVIDFLNEKEFTIGECYELIAALNVFISDQMLAHFPRTIEGEPFVRLDEPVPEKKKRGRPAKRRLQKA